MRTITTIDYADASLLLDHIIETAAADNGKPVSVSILDVFGIELASARPSGWAA